jgi:hypothetical protein
MQQHRAQRHVQRAVGDVHGLDRLGVGGQALPDAERFEQRLRRSRQRHRAAIERAPARGLGWHSLDDGDAERARRGFR